MLSRASVDAGPLGREMCFEGRVMTPDPNAAAAYTPTEDEKIWALVAHITPVLGVSFLGPILALVVKGKDSAWVRAHAIESINFNLVCFVAMMVGAVLSIVAVGLCILFPVAIANFVLAIIAGVNAWQGKSYQYPFNVRLLKP